MTTARPDPATDRARLVGAAYATTGPLTARASLYAYERDRVDLPSWVLDHVEAAQPLSARSRILDIGCGPGWYLAAVRARHPGIAAVGLDISRAMSAATSRTGTPAGVADAMQLPIRSASCDVAIATHMLYHVPDIALAAAELARVVGPSGLVAITTNGEGHLRELDELDRATVEAVTGMEWTAPAHSSARFMLDDVATHVGASLTVVGFDRVQREIVVDDPAPVAAYVESEESLYGPTLPNGVVWADVVAEVANRVASIIERDGAFTVRTHAGVVLCRPR